MILSETSQLWHALTAEVVAEKLDTDVTRGVSPSEAKHRQEKYGRNELQAKPIKSPLRRFLEEFQQPLIYILLVAALVTLLLKDWVDAGVIFAVTFINALIGFLQESKAEAAIAALAQSLTTEARVIRGGEKLRLPAAELVPGDLVYLHPGDKVPADIRLVQVKDLQLSEAALTGESLPVEKNNFPVATDTILAERSNMAYAGSLVVFGQARGIVIAIAMQTETGRISQLMEQSISLETPLTRKIEHFSRKLLYIILGLATFLFAVVIGEGGSTSVAFKSGVALAVSAIPEGLPAVITVTLAIGVARMAKRHAIIRHLPSVEVLGSTTVICSDKTGTLTENQMTVQAIYAGGEYYQVSGVGYRAAGEIFHQEQPIEIEQHPSLRECLECGFLCNDSHLQEKAGEISVGGNPTEGALIVVAQKAGLDLGSLERSQPRLDTIPFASQFQSMATLHTGLNHHLIYLKGSVEAILKGCPEAQTPKLETTLQQMTRQGLRVLALAKKVVTQEQTTLSRLDLTDGFQFLGLQGMIDPPRQEAIAAVKTCQTAGIAVKMITGDHALTAQAIAQRMGIISSSNTAVLTGQELAEMTEREILPLLEETAVFARVAPEQKLRLVEALQSQGHIVAMTGDGINDAPALKQADIGIAMGIMGTEVAKEAADMILTDDNFASIEAAVEEGRTVYSNLLKSIGFILPVNGGEALTILVGTLVAATLPILPVQILWVNMVSSVALSATLAFEPALRETMQKPPRPPQEPLLSKPLLWRVIVISLYNLAAVFTIFELVSQSINNLPLARTMAVQTLVVAETFYLLSMSHCLPSLGAYFKNKTCRVAYIPLIGVACVLLLQILFSQLPLANSLLDTYPLSFRQALLCLTAGIPVIIPSWILNKWFARYL